MRTLSLPGLKTWRGSKSIEVASVLAEVALGGDVCNITGTVLTLYI